MDDNFFDITYANSEMEDIVDRISMFVEDYPELKGVLLRKIRDEMNNEDKKL